ncbi:DNA translocase FtsK [Acinetobacter genomosp. 15BJ]|uniref:DNA translocase FtsK n=1 Tax=Acinetobacter genomosp. 15BJ TaxID=106651 RepID=R9ATK8_9GAMM|nr:DNA translocase FtsK [Acinetobacter genomosp. 15BJ]EOR05523.1 S-DNA-T family DNA segregation ATPase FtsK/SpoIIIE [Acinetobacter genomosp. 15BJ]MCH7293232.1 DNA translocase FtsK 4TM domain-containing protein [Acinetobacter genomosp. 15BJ]MDO3658447.1 DNA translocase FtsK 4TM domain-containing protein [Acinetobacter genomosp. 15BJ]
MTAVSSVYAQRFLMTLFLISFGIYLFLATVTYTPFDPGWMHISSDTQQVSNASGVAGAWIADLLFGFLGWASLLIPIFLFIEAIQVWWPRSFLNRPFRYAAQFFLILSISSLLYLHWNTPADTLDNAAGGIIGYELGQSLSQLLTIYGATLFLLAFSILLLTLAFGIQWNKTWITLKNTPAYLQDLFYKNVPQNESAYDLTEQLAAADTPAIKNKVQTESDLAADTSEAKANQVQAKLIKIDDSHHQLMAEKLFADVLAKEQQQDSQPVQTEQIEDFEQTLQRAHQFETESQRLVQTGEVWRALQRDDASHKQEIDALLRAADDAPQASAQYADVARATQKSNHSNLDWNDDQIFDELLAAVPNSKTATDLHTPFTQEPQANPNSPVEEEFEADIEALITESARPTVAQSHTVAPVQNITQDEIHRAVAEDMDDFSDLMVEEEREQASPRTTSYAQSSAFVKAPIEVSTPTQKETLSKEAFIEAWQETAGKADPDADLDIEDDFDLDAPLTDAFGRPMSRAMQVAQKRRDLPTLPGLELLDEVDPNKKVNFTAEQLARLSELLEIKLQEFNVKAQVVEAQPGPVVTRFELDLAPGVKASKVTNISRDLARSMSMASVRVVEVIAGKPYIGIEVPNSSREMVRLIELLKTPAFEDPAGLLSMAMGKDISGNPVITDLGKAPHMLVAGTTGSGKSVAVNSMILSMLLKYTPDQLRLILIDPKQLELANYNDIPHLLTPVVTDMKDAVSALNWCVNEMERRYKLMSFLKIRKLSDYNRKVEEAIANGEDLIDPTWKASDSVVGERAPRLTPLPSIVIVADEFADMIMQVGKKAEEMITRLAQKSRAAGIHLLLATQRPSVDVITGLIKANIPTRVALRVNSKIDSRTILDAGGAEDLLGHGDMLFLGPGKIEPERVHGAFISDDEVNRICDAWRERGEPNYVDEILTPFDEESSSRGFEDGDGDPSRDALYDQCVSFVLETRKASTSSLQRKFSLGYNRAARIIDQMEENGIVSSMGANGKRDILV